MIKVYLVWEQTYNPIVCEYKNSRLLCVYKDKALAELHADMLHHNPNKIYSLQEGVVHD